MTARDRPWPWTGALVTGASSGIGESIARRLAAGGVRRLVLVARREAHLDALAKALAPAGVDCEVLAADLATAEGCALVERRLVDPGAAPLDLVVNNAARSWNGPFMAADAGLDEELIRLNVVALTRLTRAAIGPMRARGAGAVLNVSSMSAYQPGPGVATYAATKAYVVHLSEALFEELRGSGVTVTTLLPGFTRTDMASGDTPVSEHLWLLPDDVADAGLRAAARGRALCIPGAPYKALAAWVTPLPRSTRRWLMGRAVNRVTGGRTDRQTD